MNSRQRFINAINHKYVDRVPLYLRLWDMGSGVDNIPFKWKDQVSRVENILQLGVDDTLLLEPPLGYPENYIADRSTQVNDVLIEFHDPESLGAPKVIKKIYKTPAGELNQVVRLGETWPHGKDVMLFSDHNISGYMEPIIKTPQDLPRLKCLLSDPSDDQIKEFKTHSQGLHQEAKRLNVALEGGWSALGDSVVWLCGMENLLYWQMDQPEFVEALLDILLEWELNRIDHVLCEGVDVYVHMAWYEGTDFWTPKNFQNLLKPRLKQIIEKVHQKRIPFRYIITKGWWPLRHDYLDLGIDCLTGIDPVQDNVDLTHAKNEIGADICLMGGMNAAVTLSSWSDQEIRQAVDKAIASLSPGLGFILFPVDNIACEWKWKKTELIIDQWKKSW